MADRATPSLPFTLLLASVERVLNGYLGLDPETQARLAALAGKAIAIELLPFDLSLCLQPGHFGIRLHGACPQSPDVVLRGTPLALLRLQQASAVGQTLREAGIEVRGDMELAQRFRSIVQDIEIDWEELLSRPLGDVVAHQIGRAGRAGVSWGNQVRSTLSQNLTEYLQEEARLLPGREEVEELLSGIDALRMDTDRLAQRVQRLTRQAQADGSTV
jgi:ubiquinone biosynthesis accessory factor UbiJ